MNIINEYDREINRIKLIYTNEEKIIYLKNLIGKIYKILPIFENKNDNDLILIIYLNGLLLNISSANQMFNGILIDILVSLNEIIINDMDHKNLKKVVFECINKVTNLKEDLEMDIIRKRVKNGGEL